MIDGFSVVALVALMIYGWLNNWGLPVSEEDEANGEPSSWGWNADLDGFDMNGNPVEAVVEAVVVETTPMTPAEIHAAYWDNRGRNSDGTFTRQG